MVSKKYTLLAILLLTLGVASYAQTTGWDWKDSSVVPVKSITQYNEFMQNTNPFPAKPRNAWEFSFGVGPSSITGDKSAGLGVGASLNLRKALNNIFSYRLGYFGSYNVGGNGTYYSYSNGYSNSSITAPLHTFYANRYHNVSHNFAIDLIASLNTFSNYRGDPTSNLYVLAGVGLGISSTKIKDSTSGSYVNQGHIPGSQLLYQNGNTQFFTTFDLGAGYAYKINKKFNIAIEERIISPVKHVNYLTGYNSQTGTKNIYYFTAFKLNFNLMK